MKFRKIKGLALAMLCAGSLAYQTPVAAENPTCIFMQFVDDTRFDKIESAASLSDLVMEKMVASGKFNLKETKPIDDNFRKKLYEEEMGFYDNVSWAINSGNLNSLFESDEFREDRAMTIATAMVGQRIQPRITSAIGKQHGAEYLIQGTIINIGTGDWIDDKLTMTMTYVQSALPLMGNVGMGLANTMAGSFLGPLGGLLSSVGVNKTSIGVQCDMRIIRAATGEVVWNKRVTGLGSKTQVKAGFLKVGSTKLDANLYAKAMEQASKKIVDCLIADMDANALFTTVKPL